MISRIIIDLKLAIVGWCWLFSLSNNLERSILVAKVVVWFIVDWNDIIEDIVKSILRIGDIIYKKRKSKLKRR